MPRYKSRFRDLLFFTFPTIIVLRTKRLSEQTTKRSLERLSVLSFHRSIMFSTHNINSNNLSIRNLILLFLTIVMGFASVITLAQISIPTSIDNARQTIAKITITNDGTDGATKHIEFSSWGIYIDSGILNEQLNFSGKVLGIDDSGNVIYVLSQNLVVSWAGGGGDSHRTGDNAGDISNLNSGNVGIGTSTPTTGKLHIRGNNQVELLIEESNPGNAANMHFKNPVRTRSVGANSSPDIFYIGLAWSTVHLAMTATGWVGIGTHAPKANLQIVGNFIAGNYNNTSTQSTSSIAWGSNNNIYAISSFIWGWSSNTIETWEWSSNIIWGVNNTIAWLWWNSIVWWQGNKILTGGRVSFIWWWGNNQIHSGEINFIWWWQINKILWNESVIVWGYENKITPTTISLSEWIRNFIGGGGNNTITGTNINYGVIWWGQANTITSSSNAFIGGGLVNKITSSNFSFIGGGQTNTITWTSTHSVIPGWRENTIEWSPYSFAAGLRARIINTPNTFVRNSHTWMDFTADRQGSFLINVPMGDRVGWVGINTPNPQAALHVSGHILGHSITLLQDNAGLWCAPGNKGQIILSGDNFFGCNGSIRRQLDN